MCGIFGVLQYSAENLTTTKQVKLLALINALAVNSSSRGEDASGIAVVNRSGGVQYYKDAVPSYDLIRRRAWRRLLRNSAVNSFAMLGHTRYATHGKNTRNNAHPFVFTHETHGPLVGTHNGVIDNHDILTDEVHTVDSANVFRRLSMESLDQWINTLGILDGRYALAYSRNGVVYLARNSGSPAYIGWNREMQLLVYASTSTILHSAAALANLVLENVHELRTNTIYEFHQNKSRPQCHKIKPIKSENSHSIIHKKTFETSTTSSVHSIRLKQKELYEQDIKTTIQMCTFCGLLTKIELMVPTRNRLACKTCWSRLPPHMKETEYVV